MKRKLLKDYEGSASRLVKIMEDLKENLVFVEGKKDKEALARLGIVNVLTISGNLRASCEKAKDAKKVIVLSDLDRRGNELALHAVEELQRYSIHADIETRKIIGGILKLRFFEDIDKKYNEFTAVGR